MADAATADRADLGGPSLAEIRAAAARIQPHLVETPVLRSAALDTATGARLAFKCEALQRAGSFKARGAFNAVLSLTDAEASCGVATHSSGNHGAALAAAAQARGVSAHVVTPETAPDAKRALIDSFGAQLTVCGPGMAAREAACAALLERTGATFIHPYDDPRVIAGQASCALELMAQAPDLDAAIAPIGGGGLIAGTCLALADRPDVEVFAAEPVAADDAHRSLVAGRRITPETPPETVADALKATLSERTFRIAQAHLTEIVTVEDREILAALRMIWRELKVLIEPSCAAPLAAILKRRERFAGRHIGVILTGGNLDLSAMPRWLGESAHERCEREQGAPGGRL
ncbi:MAG: threonine/serine dehydratase [Pseudomonadota bacterium]